MIAFSPKGIVQNEALIETRIRSLENNPRYLDLILEYFNKQQEHGRKPQTEIKYRSVLDIVSNFWKHSSKNPSIFKEVKEFEPLLQKIPYYRDHFLHSLNVFLLGYYVINRSNEIHPAIDWRSNDHNLTWMLTSTFHDIAYAIQEIDKWMNALLQNFLGVESFSFDISRALPMIYDDFLRMISQWHRRPLVRPMGGTLDMQDWTFYNKLCNKLSKKEHGVLGGIMLAHLLAVREGFTERENTWDFFYNHLPACHAICLHHLKVPIKFELHPIAFLLSLCDELQDWGRPSNLLTLQSPLIFRNIDVTKSSSTHRIKVVVEIQANKRRKESLRKALTNLCTSGGISVSIMDNKKVQIFEII